MLNFPLGKRVEINPDGAVAGLTVSKQLSAFMKKDLRLDFLRLRPREWFTKNYPPCSHDAKTEHVSLQYDITSLRTHILVHAGLLA